MTGLPPDDPRRELFGKHGFDAALPGMTLGEVGATSAEVTLEVSEQVANMVGTLHGGAIATLVDVAGTIAIMAADQAHRPGVTTDLNVSYFAAGRLGDTVTARAQVLKSGKTLAFVSVDLTNPQGALLAQGRMTKFMGR
ncbi:MAG: PaaI family thioesterase [Planctomycetota bacterium]